MSAGDAAPRHDAPGAGPSPGAAVRRRHVLYLCGFDPQGPANYYALYREQAALQARTSAYELKVGRRQREGLQVAWDLEWRAGADTADGVHTRYEFLRWDDLVRAHWPRDRLRLIGLTLATTWQLTRNGTLWRFLQTTWPSFLVTVAPALLVLAVAMAGVGLLGAVVWLHAVLAGHPEWQALTTPLTAPASATLALAAGLVGAAGLTGLARRAQRWVQMDWLMRSARVILRQARGQMPDLEARLDGFAARLQALWNDPELDEVLLVGHSSGAMLAVSVAARAVRAVGGQPPAHFGLLTLGQCIPVLSYQPEAVNFRRELALLRHCPGLVWVDYSSPADGCCAPLVDPTAVCEDGLPDSQRQPGGPKRLNPRFAELFAPQVWRQLRRDKYRVHFQYLMAGERAGDYDYFLLTAGDRTLAQRTAAQRGVAHDGRFEVLGGPRR